MQTALTLQKMHDMKKHLAAKTADNISSRWSADMDQNHAVQYVNMTEQQQNETKLTKSSQTLLNVGAFNV